MIDVRLTKMIDNIIDYSLNIQPGERVMIETSKNCSDAVKYLIKKISARSAIPFIYINETDIKRELIINGSSEQFIYMKKNMESMLENTDVYINMIDSDNCYDMSDVPDDKKALYQECYFKPIYFDIIVPKKRWITVDFPSVSSAQQFGMSTEAYEKYFFSAMNTNYFLLEKNMKPLKKLLDKGNTVTIKSPTADLCFSIQNQKSAICSGKINLPDGEIFIGPDLYSANGEITFNVPTRYQGNMYEELFLKFIDGKVTDYNSKTNMSKLTNLLESNLNNKYIGEFAIGTNPNIEVPRSNILFDEKIFGSFHIALGNAHDLSDNGSRAPIHWDIVNMLTPEYGGGCIYIDDILIQKDGWFIPSELEDLNEMKRGRKRC